MTRSMIALIGPIGLPELLVIFFILILVFGAKRLSGLGSNLGQAIRGFKREMREDKDKDTDKD